MSFFERAKAAATDLAAKADVAMQNAGINTPGPGSGGGGDRALRDLGVLAYLEATGRPGQPADRERLLAELRDLESTGRLGPLTLTPSYAPGAPPPPPGAAATAAGVPAAPPPPPGAGGPPPPPPAGAAPPPAPSAAPSAPPAAPEAPEAPPAAPPGSTPPPPPPSWA